jgi:transforming growth factor-beta-induced protein
MMLGRLTSRETTILQTNNHNSLERGVNQMGSFIQSRRVRRRVALLVILPICLAATTTQVRGESGRSDLVDTAVAAGDFGTLVAAVKAAGLVETLKGRGPFTVFAPTDAAFNDLPKETLASLLRPENKGQLQAILTYHVVPGRVSARAAFGLSNAATVNGERLKIERREGRLVIGEASLVATDIQCSNGVIHVIDRVLLPEQKRIPAVAAQVGKFKTLLAAASAAGLGDVLSGDGPLTLFAPTDEAFSQLPAGTVESLLEPENKAKLVRILKYHVLSGRVYAEQAAAAKQASTLLGRAVETSVTADGLRINDALVIRPDLETANGVIHVIDSVLLPKSMNRQQALQTLEDAIRRGVPVYNQGQHSSCAAIYTTACRALVSGESAQLPPEVMASLQTTLDRAERIHHAGERAWALRHGIDSALASLRQMSLVSPGIESE